MRRYVLRIWLPDRPGALGHVAGRIGGLHGDVIGIEILERSSGQAFDELVVELPEASPIELLISEITEVEGVNVEDVQPLPGDLPDPVLVALDAAASLVERRGDTGAALQQLCLDVVCLLTADWCAVVGFGPPAFLIASRGSAPAASWLVTLASGVERLEDGGPEKALVAVVPGLDIALVAGRSRRPFRRRERNQIAALARIAGAGFGPPFCREGG